MDHSQREYKSQCWYEKAIALIPGGVNSPVRAFGAVGGVPRFIREAQGCRLTDVDGRSYVDYIGSWGAAILGHADDRIVEAVTAAARRGTSFGTPCPQEVELAQEIVSRVPSVDMVRMVNSGTEAVMSAIRLARAATERDLIVKFAGGYHGHTDAMLVQAGSGVATLTLPDSPGVTEGCAADTIVAPYNDIAAITEVFDQIGSRIAAVIVEPVAGNMGVVQPIRGFLQTLRELTSRCGALLIFDEVMTGFRVARGGAQQLFSVTPDLSTFGKIIGGGLPIGAYGGRRDLMELIAPAGPVYQAGTLSGNPVAMAAGLATLRALDDAAYEVLEARSAKLSSNLQEVCRQRGIDARVQRVGSMLTLFFTVQEVTDFVTAKSADHERFAAFFHGMLSRGVHLPPSGYEAWFVSLMHDDAAIDETIRAADAALEDVLEIQRR